ncbi:MAG TPA: serine/threonine-protein kinase [Pseudolysinimonas sp.]|nr:serine/threonine-protein kinase [Pseudolysinimonas sp.]
MRAPSAPPVIEGYTVDRAIGTGGFSDVFLYEQALPKRRVAVKVMLAHELTAAARAAFVSEANLMAALSTHPYIVTIYHAGVAGDGRPYLVMEYCSRPSLAERYKRQPLSVADALRTGIRVAGAVATAHAAGILHRDIKPGNVLTNDYGWPALTDFGIASVFDGAGAEGVAAQLDPAARDDTEGTTGTIGLSVPWSPPEMFVDVPTPDVRSDVFSLAATIHTVLAGRTPFEVAGGPNGTLDLVSRIERGAVTPLTRADVPVSLVAALAKGMAPRREDRYSSAVEFARALQRIELELGYAPTGIEVPVIDVEPVVAPDGGEDETRMRAIPTVDPQPAAPRAAPASEPPVVAASSDSEQTVLAAPGRVIAPEAPDARPRRTWIGILVGVVAALAVAAIVIAVVVGGGGVRPSASPSPTASGGSAILGGVRPATDGGATVSADGSSVVFTWTNPAPKPGDIYYWARSETPDARAATPQPTATVTGIVPGSRVCIDVEIGRNGATSEPLRICSAS